ncbi:hypothetical protein CcaverHIS002_0505080 [Cutaneotrichosporon cavernicola]|uniref:Uncharacterized protein n=1 Tax=Cutaneotrichosporon cavernicola TaxID=279322 RepID=A0AA48L6N8_9TREE|nr:uncharacterized protein CcaverHIS019_0505610 [Cutaneotrichosporon cavernicola]BEI85107.1 hypothetical protein CcaverHIS002_0505080 [Cutaneotrichosporon cavernicola]BEI92933.1 hypothetical protein CcaverHIS019_0505610 [Cutaneotrichosporon cavernicola]BEJ00709.1 hypothetical protein CcaverHIS631_0505660 [Cutaneotrichosporon cavernicola]BEJ08476.1 hypothetical protein CcaverHIS641_0505700 [Cutaneotrichosporon cavernicola]
MRPNLADELVPVPHPSERGGLDALATALRRSASVAVIIVFLLGTVFYIITEPEHGTRAQAAHMLRRWLWAGDEVIIAIKADR